MGQFKPMVKMETTEPSVVLKLKKGGHVNMKKGGNGHSPMKKMDGGPMGDMGAMNTPAMIRPPVVGGPSIGSPRRPSMADRRKMMAMAAMMKNRPAAAAPMGGLPTMKKGGKAGEVETPAMHKEEMKGIKGIGKDLKSHESKPASKAHDGLKKGGATKKFADGGRVDSGRAVSMPQGHKKPTPSVATKLVAGTFKKGGKVSYKQAGGVMPRSVTVEKEKVTTSVPPTSVPPVDVPTKEETDRLTKLRDEQRQKILNDKGYKYSIENPSMRKNGGMC